jgi:hypothetical protein
MQSWHSRWAASVPKLGVWEEGQHANVTSSQGESELRCTTAATLMCGGTAGMSRRDLLSKQHSKLARTDMQDRQLQRRTLSWLPAAWQYLIHRATHAEPSTTQMPSFTTIPQMLLSHMTLSGC